MTERTPQIKQLINNLANLSNKLSKDPAQKLPKLCHNLKPTFEYNGEEKKFNTDIIHYEQLKDLEKKLEFEFTQGHSLKVLLIRYLHMNYPDRTVSDYLINLYEKTFALDYLVILKHKQLTIPSLLPGKKFTPGFMELRLYILDFKNMEPICVDSISINTKEKFRVWYDKKHNRVDLALERSARSYFKNTITRMIGPKLSEMTGQKVILIPNKRKR